MRRWRLLVAIALLMPVGCDRAEPGDSPRTIALLLSKNEARPGEVITLAVKTRWPVLESVEATLYGWQGGQFGPMFHLFKAYNDQEPTYAPFGREGLVIPAVGLRSGVPRRIKIPDGLPPENYRLSQKVSVFEEPQFKGAAERPEIVLEAHLRVLPASP